MRQGTPLIVGKLFLIRYGYTYSTCPEKGFKVKEIREPWLTNEIIEEIKDRLLKFWAIWQNPD